MNFLNKIQTSPETNFENVIDNVALNNETSYTYDPNSTAKH